MDGNIEDDPDKCVGEEYIEEWKNPQSGVVTFYCSLCGCQFDNKLIVSHSKGIGHRLQYRAFKEQETAEDRLVNAKHLEISLSKLEFDFVQDIVLDCEKALKRVSDIFGKRTSTGDMGNIDCESGRTLLGVMRCGLLSAGLLMCGEVKVELILLTADKPTGALLHQVAEKLLEELNNAHYGKYSLATDVEEGCIFVSSVAEPAVICQISVTSALMRTHPFRYYNEIAPPDPLDVLPREKCEDALRRMRRSRWYEMKVYPLPYCDLVIRILRDLCLRVATWVPLELWVLQVLVQKAVSCSDANTSSPSRALQAVFECLSAGILLQDSPGLYDPCEREPTDLCQMISLQERECITTSAQHALRLIACGQIYRILGMTKSAVLTAEQGALSTKRKRTQSDDESKAEIKKMSTAY